MLSEAEKLDIERELEHLPSKSSACVDALKIVQKHRRWISDEAVADIAEALEMSKAEVDSVATFYNLIFRKPVGKHVIMVCDSISCWICGEEAIMSKLQGLLGIKPGQTTEDGLFTLLPTVCLGHCEQAPAMILDGRIIGNLNEEKIEGIVAELRGKSSKT